jgi:hypothetical protein
MAPSSEIHADALYPWNEFHGIELGCRASEPLGKQWEREISLPLKQIEQRFLGQ